MGLIVNPQMAKTLTVNRQKHNIFTVNRRRRRRRRHHHLYLKTR